MKVEIHHRPGNTAAKIHLESGRTCTAESGAMIAMSGDMSVTTTTHKKGKGSILRAVKRMISGESLFLNHFTAGGGGGELWVSPVLAGDVMEYRLEKENLIVQSGSFLACDEGVDMDMGWQGFKSVFSGESLFWLHMKGEGTLLLNAFGVIYPVDVDGEYIVDTGHIVAFQETLDFSISKAGASWIGSFLGGEGLVTRFKGKGRVWCQSHNPRSFGRTLGPKLKPVKK